MQQPDKNGDATDMVLQFQRLQEVDGAFSDANTLKSLGKIIWQIDCITSRMHLDLLQTLPLEDDPYQQAMALMHSESSLITQMLTHAPLTPIQVSRYNQLQRNTSLRIRDTQSAQNNAKVLPIDTNVQSDVVLPEADEPFKLRLAGDDENDFAA